MRRGEEEEKKSRGEEEKKRKINVLVDLSANCIPIKIIIELEIIV
jgi:hypothetical protein